MIVINPKVLSHVVCPRCGGDELCQTSVVHFFRDAENAEKGTMVEINSADRIVIRHNVSMVYNPSREDGMQITMKCKDCGELKKALNVVQRDGKMYLFWGKSCAGEVIQWKGSSEERFQTFNGKGGN